MTPGIIWKLTGEVIGKAGAMTAARAKPMDNTDLDVYWQKEVVPGFGGYAPREIRGDDMRAMRGRCRNAGVSPRTGGRGGRKWDRNAG